MVELEPVHSAPSNTYSVDTSASARSHSRGRTTDNPYLSRVHSGRGRPPNTNLTRIYSSQHLDDQSFYHDWHSEHHGDSDGSGDNTPDTNEKLPGDVLADGKETDRTAIANEGDLESGGAPLEKKKTSRSVKDPNLVSNGSCAHISHQ